MDFYWHYSNKEIIDPAGKENFCRAIMVSKQVFASLTEYVQVSFQLLCTTLPLSFIQLTTIVPTESDSDVMFCLQSYHGLIINRSLVY